MMGAILVLVVLFAVLNTLYFGGAAVWFWLNDEKTEHAGAFGRRVNSILLWTGAYIIVSWLVGRFG